MNDFTTEQLATEPILRYFHYAHLPEPLQSVSAAYCTLAAFIVEALPRNAERRVSLRKLLEAKDAGVRANVGSMNKPVETFYDRLVEEHSDLKDKTEKLNAFLGSKPYRDLSEKSRALLRDQFHHMIEYESVLDARIALLDAAALKNQWNEPEYQILGGDRSETPVPFKD